MKTLFAVALASVGGAALLLPGCAVGPNYKRPAINSPSNFRNASAERFEVGGASKLDTARAEAAQASTAANVPDIERQIVLKENQISVLLGQHAGPVAHSAGSET